ncbi:hypothetical protein MARBORIA2_14870 [Methanobrevibacter arboriphilus]|jgi:hypothetical protein|uniref:Uncharacterized protein n=1 Tax=Methanobrevibacter arboriphilus TaxID=39441 RepID=A0ACA8R1S9_METAZ|nr:carboxypeptidase-like regulatory domain-containing protein [Methanobrevibacter arboriphilus]BBL61511.1 hypothetical protein MarbSA_05510 [Methanobrevibacter arboriphilus]GLI12397.1 hypothetical protein MARBORIA2_14870 [Methanobrevibacter arboriphilus]
MTTTLDKITNQEAAFKNMTNIKDGKAILSPEHLGQFLAYAALDNIMLAGSKPELMNAPEKNLNRAGIVGRVLTNGYDDDGNTRELGETEKKSLSFGANTLIARKLKACAKIQDEDIEDNITGEGLVQFLLSEMGRAIGEDLSLYTAFGDSDLTKSQDPLLCISDGWFKKAAHQLEVGTDFDMGGANQVERLFNTAIKKLSPRFRKRDKLVFYVPFEVEDAYRELLASRQTGLGDATQIGFAELKYKQISIKNPNALDDPEVRELIASGKMMLTDPKNLAWGIRKNMSIEPERKAGLERTDYWFRVRGDMDMYFREGAVTTTIPLDILEESLIADGGDISPIETIPTVPVFVKDSSDNPIDGAKAVLKNSDNVTRQVTVGVDGKGVLNSVVAGDWTATVTATGYETLIEPVTINDDTEISFTLTAE